MTAAHPLFPGSILLRTALQTRTVFLALHHSEITLHKTEEKCVFNTFNFSSTKRTDDFVNRE